MSTAIAITRTDHDATELRCRALIVREPDQARRMLAIAMVLEGASRLDAARQAGMDRQTLRDWVLRYNAGGIGGLASRKPPGSAPKLTEAEMDELRELMIKGPDPKVHKVIRWRCLDLRAEVKRRFSVTMACIEYDGCGVLYRGVGLISRISVRFNAVSPAGSW